jgi:hypothetical protein
MGLVTDPQVPAGLTLEVVQGIDNLVFIAISAGRTPPERQNRARRAGLVGTAGANAESTNLTEVAADFGFWKLGRCSGAYRPLLGEPYPRVYIASSSTAVDRFRNPTTATELRGGNRSSCPIVDLARGPTYGPA